MSPAPRAAFDIPADPPGRRARLRGRFDREPTVLRAATPAEVPDVVEAAEAAALAGHWVLGGLSYAASGAWDWASGGDGKGNVFEKTGQAAGDLWSSLFG